MLTDFQNYFAGRLNGKFATNSYLNIPPHLKYVAALPCKIWMSENRQQSQICIVIDDKSQGNAPKHLSCGELFLYKFMIQFSGERILKIGEHLVMLQAKWLIVS